MAMVTGGELVIRTLTKAGTENIFGLHGGHTDSIFQACLDHGLKVVDTRHEVAAGHAAEAFARATRGLGVALVTAGPGFTNVITSIANAYLDRTPVLYITGAAALREAETNTLQSGIDQVGIATPITKWAHRITRTEDIPRLVAQAVRTALSAPSGPILLDIPSDVLTATVEEDAVHIPENLIIDAVAAPQEAPVAAAIDLLAGAERPVMMVGADAWMSGIGEELQTFAETTGIPVFSDFQGHGLLPADHRLYGGTFHKMGDLTAATGRPDTVLALGMRFGLFTLGGSDILVPTDAKVIHVDVDGREIGRLRDTAVPIIADAREALRALLAAARARSWPDFGDWVQTIADARTARRARLEEALTRTGPPVHPYQAVSAIVESIPEDTVIIGDGAEAYHWMNEVIQQKRPGSYITHGFLGSVGFGLGLSLGAQTAHPDRPVLCLAGDGAIGITIAEFDTLVRHKLPVVVVVMNNQSWGASQHFQEMVAGANRVFATRLENAQYHEVAAGFGCRSAQVTDAKDLGPAIQAAFESGKPTCINVLVDIAPMPPEVVLLTQR